MKYFVLINPNSAKSNALIHAIDLINALIQEKQQVISVFFYGYAVKAAFIKNVAWEKVAKQSIPLFACSTIADEYLAKNCQQQKHFQLAGLANWMESALSADKYLEIV